MKHLENNGKKLDDSDILMTLQTEHQLLNLWKIKLANCFSLDINFSSVRDTVNENENKGLGKIVSSTYLIKGLYPKYTKDP